MRIGGKLLEGADVPPERYEKPQGFSLSLNVPTADEAERLFDNFQGFRDIGSALAWLGVDDGTMQPLPPGG